MGYIGWGAAREEIAVDAKVLSKVPDSVSFEEAAGLLVTYGTTLHAFRDRAALQPGESVAILGASGGVGQAAIEVAKVMGARVIACASSEEKLRFCRDMGADETVNYEQTDLKEELAPLTGGRGVDVVYDPWAATRPRRPCVRSPGAGAFSSSGLRREPSRACR